MGVQPAFATNLCTSPVRRLRTTGDSQTFQEATAYGLFANAAFISAISWI